MALNKYIILITISLIALEACAPVTPRVYAGNAHDGGGGD